MLDEVYMRIKPDSLRDTHSCLRQNMQIPPVGAVGLATL